MRPASGSKSAAKRTGLGLLRSHGEAGARSKGCDPIPRYPTKSLKSQVASDSSDDEKGDGCRRGPTWKSHEEST